MKCAKKINKVINKSNYSSKFYGSNRLDTGNKKQGGTDNHSGPFSASPSAWDPRPCGSGDHWLQHPVALWASGWMEWERPSPGKCKLWPGKEEIQPAATVPLHYHLSEETLHTWSFTPSMQETQIQKLWKSNWFQSKFLNNPLTLKTKKVVGNLECCFWVFFLTFHLFDYTKKQFCNTGLSKMWVLRSSQHLISTLSPSTTSALVRDTSSWSRKWWRQFFFPEDLRPHGSSL